MLQRVEVGAHPVPQVFSEDSACCSLVQSRCFRLSLAAEVFSRRKLANPIPFDFSAAQAVHTPLGSSYQALSSALTDTGCELPRH